MRKLDRYILRELFAAFGIGVITVMTMFLINLLSSEFQEFQRGGAPMAVVLEYVSYKIPSFIKTAIPIAIAFASAFSFSRLTRESELTAMRSAGISVFRIVLPVLSFGIFIAVVNFLLSEKYTPLSEQAAHELRYQYYVEVDPSDSRSNVIVNLQDYIVSFSSIYRTPYKSVELRSPIFLKEYSPGNFSLIEARSGLYQKSIWRFQDVIIREIKHGKLVSFKTQQDLVFKKKIKIASLFSPKPHEELTASKLRKAIQEGREQKQDTIELEVAYYEKFSIPFGSVVFALTGPLVAVFLARSGAFMGVLLSILLVLGYYNAQVISSEILGGNQLITPFLAAWMPNILFLGLGMVLLRRVE